MVKGQKPGGKIETAPEASIYRPIWAKFSAENIYPSATDCLQTKKRCAKLVGETDNYTQKLRGSEFLKALKHG
mgnify:CR=1 FL=1